MTVLRPVQIFGVGVVTLGKRLIHKKRDMVWVKLTVSPMWASGEEPNHHIVILEDVTDRRRTEEELRESRERFRQLTESIDQVFWLTDWINRTLLYVSPSYESIFGRSCESLYGDRHSWHECIHRDDRERVAKTFAEGAARGQIVDEEYRIIRGDGSERWIRDRAFPIRNENGDIYRIVGLGEDITDRRTAQELARQRQAELAHVSRLSHLGEMATGLAHELNQPLAAIASYMQGCLRRLESDSFNREELLDAIQQTAAQAERAADIIKWVRAFVRKGEHRRKATDLNELVREVAQILERELATGGVSLRLELAADLPYVDVDHVQIQQVILNLMRNGMEATAATGRARHTITVRTSPTDGPAVELAVQDTGDGVRQEVMDRLFEPFVTSKEQGMGMGLSISRSIVDAHGGRLWLAPNRDRGCTFLFTLPLSQEQPVPN